MPTDRRIVLDDRSQLSETALDESLALLSLLDSAEPSEATHTSTPPHESGTVYDAQFLDHLSWLCDPLPEGKTVAAIGVQHSRDRYKFWIASNNGCRSSVKRHLQWLLRTFQEVIEGRTTRDAARKDIFQRSIEISSERVKNYLARLAKVVVHCSRLKRTCGTGKNLQVIAPAE
ncbi:hypothetical protein LTR47_009919 [Exophiala xenobiotica]|nr:hypothetical protein LTR47_009919 [Exophiala xenobiotica]KAK5250337.1 hypothetical protein LTS06_004915 [Exophiala xenobiotica]KAK5284241.1 hypothetical protein LTR40_000519 [Exophiala xenobiotica]KAK5345796.1 hypothetical protein LTR61_010497 [Exophiala xenobiotica]KAK5359174.1 hypothetical protein LTR11_010602 [Exophiala xenobiotica]